MLICERSNIFAGNFSLKFEEKIIKKKSFLNQKASIDCLIETQANFSAQKKKNYLKTYVVFVGVCELDQLVARLLRFGYSAAVEAEYDV